MREGKNREIRNVLGALGLLVNRLIRISYGPFQLGDLPPGTVTEVRTRTLREQLGERLVRQAGADFFGPLQERGQADAPISPRHSGALAKRANPASRDKRSGEPLDSGSPRRGVRNDRRKRWR
jgi:23S rRNA pseudouridine2605 synthase